MAEDYVRRVSHYAKMQMLEIRAGRTDPWLKHPSAYLVCLDPAGKRLDSAALVALVERIELEARDVGFMVGGAEGLTEGWSKRAYLILPDSPVTYSHQRATGKCTELSYCA